MILKQIKKQMKKDIVIGMIIGLIANSIGLILVATLFGGGDDFTTVIKSASNEGFLGKLISLGAILNLGAFFVTNHKLKLIRIPYRYFCTRLVPRKCLSSGLVGLINTLSFAV